MIANHAEASEQHAWSAEEQAAFAEFSARVEGTLINPRTLLATDYLNHFNTITALLDSIPHEPERLEQALDWRPKSYRDHFSDSAFDDRDLAVEAYMYAPAKYREPFDAVTSHMERVVVLTLGQIQYARNAGDATTVHTIAASAARHLRTLCAFAGNVILGGNDEFAPGTVDDLLAAWR